MFNKVNIMGTLTDNIQLKYSQAGVAIGNFSIAVNEKYKGQDGSMVEKAHFFKVTVFGSRAETINSFFHKGSRILIDGSLVQEKWKDATTGEDKYSVSIKLNSFEFVDRKGDGSQQQWQQQNQQGQSCQPQQQQNYQPQQNQQKGMP